MLIKKVIEIFQKNEIDYALAGGYAVALHGAVRGTVDIDFVVRLEESNLVKIEASMKALGLVSRLPVSAHEIFTFREEYIQNKNLKVWTFVNSNMPTEIVDIIIIYDLKYLKVERKKTVFGDINIISIDELIKMKKEAGRPQDLADIEALTKLKKK